MRLLSLVIASFCLLTQSAEACSVETQPVVFGSVDVTRNNTANGRITLSCPQAAIFSLSIGSANDGASRIMSGPSGAQLRYQLFADPGFIQPWGDGGATGAAISGSVGAGSVTEFTVYGLVPSQNLVPGGSYSDLPIVTLLF